MSRPHSRRSKQRSIGRTFKFTMSTRRDFNMVFFWAPVAGRDEPAGHAASDVVKVYGCRPHDGGAAHTGGRRPQTSKGGNRGKGYVRRCGVGYREFSTARNFDFVAGGFSKNLGLEEVHNFCVMAQVLLTGESRFLSPSDFRELRVIKRARFTTSTLAASQHSLSSIVRTDR